ncbi:MAG: dihydroorotase [Oscillospiraceae bacterium]|jgi:dihydroorotase|nr:dihydroorotase [Oscillospiraceae bacterium]
MRANRTELYEMSERVVLPGFVDLHVHLREPGFSHKETIATGLAAAKRGGYAAVVAMPNTEPPPDCPANLEKATNGYKKNPKIPVFPTGCISAHRAGTAPAAYEELAPFVCGYSDDGSGIADNGLMREAMQRVKALGKPILSHCEDLTQSGNAMEWKALERDLNLVVQTECRYHMCHCSARESVALLREAKRAGLPVTAETAPHYLTLLANGSPLPSHKMNPPLARCADQAALLEAIQDGTIDCIATDHAPHTAAEKEAGANGVVGLETAFPVLYTKLVLTEVISLEKLLDLMAYRPAELLLRWTSGNAEPFRPLEMASYTWDLVSAYTIDPAQFASMGRYTPFAGWKVRGRCLG